MSATLELSRPIPREPVLAIPESTAPQERKFTRDEYHLAAEAGIIRPEERVELIRGKIIAMAPQGDWHAWHTENAGDILRHAFEPEFYVREEKPVIVSDESEPEPDVIVARGSRTEYFGRNPLIYELVLAVEVAQSSLPYDQNTKASLYAEAGLPEYWVLNKRDNRLEVYREPGESSPGVFGYNSARYYHGGEELSPLEKPDVILRVDDLLPQRPETTKSAKPGS